METRPRGLWARRHSGRILFLEGDYFPAGGGEANNFQGVQGRRKSCYKTTFLSNDAGP